MTSDGRILLYFSVTWLHLDRLQFFHPDFETNRKHSFLASIPETPAGLLSRSLKAPYRNLLVYVK